MHLMRCCCMFAFCAQALYCGGCFGSSPGAPEVTMFGCQLNIVIDNDLTQSGCTGNLDLLQRLRAHRGQRGLESMTKAGAKESIITDASIKLKEAIDFKPVHYGKKQVALYKDEDKTDGVLGDVADILAVYSSATVVVEGHTATPPEKIDSWAHELAKIRADKVKASVVTHGIDSKRLSAKGLPGNLGDGHPDVKLKIAGF